MSYIEKEKLIKADIASIENKVRHAFNQGYNLGYKEGKERAKPQDQEPFKPMVEIDLYSVIKQKYIEREVLNKIRKQIKSNLRGVEITLEVLVENDPLRPKFEGAKETLEECLEIIDKAESEKNE